MGESGFKSKLTSITKPESITLGHTFTNEIKMKIYYENASIWIFPNWIYLSYFRNTDDSQVKYDRNRITFHIFRILGNIPEDFLNRICIGIV